MSEKFISEFPSTCFLEKQVDIGFMYIFFHLPERIKVFLRVIFWISFFLCTLFNTASCPSDFIVSEDAGVEPCTVATLALTAKRSNISSLPHPHSARSHTQKYTNVILKTLKTRQDLIHTRLDLIYT